MKLRIVTPVRPVVDAEVSELVAPGSEGEFGGGVGIDRVGGLRQRAGQSIGQFLVIFDEQ